MYIVIKYNDQLSVENGMGAVTVSQKISEECPTVIVLKKLMSF